ncbi:MAG: radical SAM protein [Myxococcota bacterium]
MNDAMNGGNEGGRLHHPDIHAPGFFAGLSPAVARVLETSLSGREIGEDDATLLFDAEGADLAALLAVADHFRREANGDLVTFVVNRNINFTNRCFVGCKFCNFKVRGDSPDAYFQDLEEVARRADEAAARGATEVCIQAGLNKNLPGSHYEAVLRAISERQPGLHIHAYSPMEIHYGAKRTGRSLRDHLVALRDAGLDTLPGTAAEILVDAVRKRMVRCAIRGHGQPRVCQRFAAIFAQLGQLRAMRELEDCLAETFTLGRARVLVERVLRQQEQVQLDQQRFSFGFPGNDERPLQIDCGEFPQFRPVGDVIAHGRIRISQITTRSP